MTTTASHEVPVHRPEGEHEHPSDRIYWIIAGILAIVTAVEVALSYVEVGNGETTSALLLLGMAVKFFLVGGFFMHLKFDKPVLRNLFIGGLVLALGCYFVELFMFRRVFFPKEDRQEIHLIPSGVPQAEPRP